MDDEEDWNLQGIVDYVEWQSYSMKVTITVDDLEGKDPEEMIEFILCKSERAL